MNYTALQIAHFIISYEQSQNRIVTNLRLQKLLYFIQALFIVENDKPCFLDKIEAWQYGPVVPTVYWEYKCFAGEPIILLHKLEQTLLHEDIAQIQKLLNDAHKIPTATLVDITHKQDPWKNAYSPTSRNEITLDMMRTYFRS